MKPAPWQPEGNVRLPPGGILSLLVSRDGTLWIGGARGLANLKDGRLTRFAEFDGEGVYTLAEDRDGTLWVGTGGGSIAGRLCAIQHGTANCFGGDGRLGPGVVALYMDHRGNLWAGVKDGLWRWTPGVPKFYSLPGEVDGIQALAEDDDGALLVGWKGGIYRFIEGKTTPYPSGNVSRPFRAHRILRDRDGALWIGTTGSGLLHVHQGRTDVFSTPDDLSFDDVLGLFEDHEGNVWTSAGEGLYRFRDLPIVTLRVKQGLSRDLVMSVLSDTEGGVWLATRSGLNRWDHGRITTPQIGTGPRDGKINRSVPSSLFQDGRSRIWIAASSSLGYLEKGRFTSISGIPSGNVLSITQDTSANMWVLNESVGLVRISPQDDVHQIPWSDLGHEDNATVLSADPRRGGLWIGFFRSGIAYFSAGQIRESYTAREGLGSGRVTDFYFDSDGALWISTEGGLSRLKNNQLATLTSKNGLPCDTVYWAIDDDDHSMWLYTSCGLVQIARSELDRWASAVDQGHHTTFAVKVRLFDSSDGVRSLSIPVHCHPLVTKSRDGRLWFLPLDGVSVIDPRHLPFNKVPPPVHIEKITADDKTVDPSNGMHLPTGIRNLDIDYTALSLVLPEKVRFRVKLEGQDKDWRELVNVRHVEYTNLPPKHYRFRVLACNNSGVWNEEGAALDFVIPPAWYQTNWFRAACIALFLAMIWGLHKLRVRQLAAQFNMRLEERVAERTRVARDLHDTLLQSFQALLPLFQVGIKKLPESAVDSRKTLELALDRASEAIGEGRDAIKGLRMSTIEENDLALAIRTVGEELASGASKQTAPNFNVIVEGVSRNLHPILRDEVYRLAVEALRNAFCHAAAQNVEVEVRYDEKYFRLRVRDDGKGIPSDVLNDGREGHYGLPGMRERAKLVGGKLTIWTELDGGTEIELNIPGARAYVKSARPFWYFGKGSATERDEKEPIERE